MHDVCGGGKAAEEDGQEPVSSEKPLKKLPKDAKFSIIVKNAPGASEVPGWVPSKFKSHIGGVSQEIEVGDEDHGFGHIKGRVVYRISNWEKQLDQPNEVKG